MPNPYAILQYALLIGHNIHLYFPLFGSQGGYFNYRLIFNRKHGATHHLIRAAAFQNEAYFFAGPYRFNIPYGNIY